MPAPRIAAASQRAVRVESVRTCPLPACTNAIVAAAVVSVVVVAVDGGWRVATGALARTALLACRVACPIGICEFGQQQEIRGREEGGREKGHEEVGRKEKEGGFLSIPFLVLFCLLEWSYRGQWIDYYKSSFHYLNLDFNKKKPSILVFGDSFTANTKGYLEDVKNQFRDRYNVVNSAIPGTAPRQAYYMAERRITTSDPRLVICQLYLGNDLLDEDLPVNWNTLSFERNVYYSVSSVFRITTFINYKFAQISTSTKAVCDTSTNKIYYSTQDTQLLAPG